MGCFKKVEHSDENIEHYLKSSRQIDMLAASVLPDLINLPEYKDIDYRYYYRENFWVTESMMLVVTYDKETYLVEKVQLDDTYAFLDHAVIWVGEDAYLIPEYEFSINSFNFQVVGDAETDYPRAFGMIGTSDEKTSVAYLYFYDQDLDYISEEGENEPMKDFVQQYFEYEW